LLAIAEIQRRSNATYSLEPVGAKKEITVLASHKMGPGIIRDEEVKKFRKFGLRFKSGVKNTFTGSNEKDRILYFSPSDALDLLRA